MDVVHGFWEDNAAMHHHRVKYESCNSNDEQSRLKDERSLYACCDGNLNFATGANCSEDDSEYGTYKKNKVTRQDPMSHRIIEKRRRDRMNNCLADLSRLIPTEYLKKGRGRIEKTEIIEMAIKHMKYLQQEHGTPSEHYRLGYQECMSETMRFMVEVEGHFPREAICVRLLSHLQKHCEALTRTAPPPPVPRPPPPDLPHHAARDTTENNNGTSMLEEEEFQRTPPIKADQEVNNNNSAGSNNSNGYSERARNSSESEIYEKHSENNALYKYKTDIKLRFSQDLHGERSAKRQKVEPMRRNSVTSLENQSSSHSSPPSSDVYTRHSSESDNPHRVSPVESNTSSLNNNNHYKAELINRNNNDHNHTYKTPPQNNLISNATNFNVPVFVLHAKGSFYVPITIDYKTLLPFLHNYDLLEVVPNLHNIVLHPVTINVNFQPHFNGQQQQQQQQQKVVVVNGGGGYKAENGW